MTTAGTPATPPPSGRENSSTPSVAGAQGADAIARVPAFGPRLDAFLAEAARRRDQHTAQAGERPEDWCDPDPDAIGRVARHPVDRAAARTKPGRQHEEFLRAVRRCCARLQNEDTTQALTPEQVRAYPWHQLSVEAAEGYRRRVYADYALQSTRNDNVSTLRRVIVQCARAGLISPLRRDLLLEALYTITPGPSAKRRRLRVEEVGALLEACESAGTRPAAARNSAIVVLFWTSGIRTGELLGIDLADWDRSAQTIRLRFTKNRADHLIFLHPAAVAHLERWLQHRGDGPGALFSNLNRRDQNRPISRQSLRTMLDSRATIAGIEPFGAHDFRRTFVTTLLRTHDAALVSKLVNHKKLTSTMIYDLAAEEEQREAVATISLPAQAGEPAALTGGPDAPDLTDDAAEKDSGPQRSAA